MSKQKKTTQIKEDNQCNVQTSYCEGLVFVTTIMAMLAFALAVIKLIFVEVAKYV